MTNSLLDFVMSLVRDPDAAARYAADPAGAIADAHLTGVTSADVNGLIPVVADSMTPMGAGPTVGDGSDGDVWTSGAAAAAFDAFDTFDTHVPAQVVHAVDTVITVPAQLSADLDPLGTALGNSHLAEGPTILDVEQLVDSHPGSEQIDASLPDWPIDHHFGADHPGFDLF